MTIDEPPSTKDSNIYTNNQTMEKRNRPLKTKPSRWHTKGIAKTNRFIVYMTKMFNRILFLLCLLLHCRALHVLCYL
jgi:hypothetical protein